jgi:hypothetical protein
MRQRGRRSRYIWIILALALLVCFVFTFNPDVNRWLVNFTWLTALLIWAAGIWRTDPPAKDRHFDWRHLWVLVPFVVTFAALWLPFYDNWRWSDMGDSVGWFVLPLEAAKRGLAKSILSLDGVGRMFPYTEDMLVNFLMFVFAPTFFWHRAGNFVISTLSLLTIYAFFSLILDFPWALAIIIATAATWHFQLMSHLSWNHIDSFICAYLGLSAFTLILRDPGRRTRWLALGTVAGLSLFFTATAWTEVTVCGVAVGAWALYRRKLSALAVCGVSFLIASLPALMQFHQLTTAAAIQTRVEWNWLYLARIFMAILWLPAGKGLSTIQFTGAVASWPCGHFYFAGLGIAALSLVPWIRRRLRLPPAVIGLLCVFLLEALLMTLTNNLNSNPSPKRTYHLIPLQVFFALLPFYTLALAVRASSFAYRTVTAITFLAVAAYVTVSATLIIFPTRFGGNVFDGFIQVHQRFPDRRVLVLAQEPFIGAEVQNPDTILNMVYHVSETVAVTPTIDEALVAATCSAGNILCRYVRPDQEQFERATAQHHLRKLDLCAVGELQCFECS